MRVKLESDLLLVLIVTLCFGVVGVWVQVNPVRIILGLPIVLLFPGYTLLAVMFPRRGRFDGITRLVLSATLSVAIVPLVGLVLNYSPWGVTFFPVLIGLAAVILLSSIAAWYRRRLIDENRNTSATLNTIPAFWRGKGRRDRMLFIITIIAVLGAVTTVIYVLMTPRPGAKYSEFYLNKVGGATADYPVQLAPGQAGTVITGITNQEQTAVRYRVSLVMGGLAERELLTVELGAGQKWEQAVEFTPVQSGGPQKVEFLLYKNGESQSYAQLYLWVMVTAPR